MLSTRLPRLNEGNKAEDTAIDEAIKKRDRAIRLQWIKPRGRYRGDLTDGTDASIRLKRADATALKQIREGKP